MFVRSVVLSCMNVFVIFRVRSSGSTVALFGDVRFSVRLGPAKFVAIPAKCHWFSVG